MNDIKYIAAKETQQTINDWAVATFGEGTPLGAAQRAN